MKKKTTTAKNTKKAVVDTSEKEFKEKIAELKKSKSTEELLEVVSIQPFNYELSDFLAARKALDELGVTYPKTFKISCEERK